jgi:hypothetical protein
LLLFLDPDFPPDGALPLRAKKKREISRISRILDFKHEDIYLLGQDTVLLSKRDQLRKTEFKTHTIFAIISPRDRHEVRKSPLMMSSNRAVMFCVFGGDVGLVVGNLRFPTAKKSPNAKPKDMTKDKAEAETELSEVLNT